MRLDENNARAKEPESKITLPLPQADGEAVGESMDLLDQDKVIVGIEDELHTTQCFYAGMTRSGDRLQSSHTDFAFTGLQGTLIRLCFLSHGSRGLFFLRLILEALAGQDYYDFQIELRAGDAAKIARGEKRQRLFLDVSLAAVSSRPQIQIMRHLRGTDDDAPRGRWRLVSGEGPTAGSRVTLQTSAIFSPPPPLPFYHLSTTLQLF